MVLDWQSYLETAQTQTHEGTIKTVVRQIVRKPTKIIAQSAEDAQTENEFELYLTLLEYLKQMEPCVRACTRALHKAARKHCLAVANSQQLVTRVTALVAVFNDCKKLISPEVQSADTMDYMPLPQRECFKALTTEVGGSLAHQEAAAVDPVLRNQPVEQIDVTTKIDTVSSHQPPTKNFPVPRFKNSNLLGAHDAFFERPVIIESKEWKTSDTIWSDFGKWDFPQAMFKAPLVNKFALIHFFRPDIEVEVVCNSTKFHFGRLMFCVQTLRSNDCNDAYLKAANAFTWPEWYQISAGTNQGIKFTIPYRHYQNQLAIGDIATAQIGKMVTLQSYVSAPLQLTSAGSTPAPAEITIMARFVNPRFAGYSMDTPTAQASEAITLSKMALTTVDVVGKQTAEYIGNAAIGVGHAIKDYGEHTFGAGNSVPANLSATNSMQIRQPLFNKADDCPNTVVLGPSLGARVSGLQNFTNMFGDDMNINKFIGRPALYRTVKITSSDAKGKHIAIITLNPHQYQFTGEGFSNGSGSFYPLPVCYVAKMFKYWRGSVRLHFSIVASAFHSCRLRIWYRPGSLAGPGSPTENVAGLAQSSHLRNVLWDINKTSDMSIEVPFESVLSLLNLFALLCVVLV